MKNTKNIYKLVTKISFNTLQEYLLLRNWRKLESKNQEIAILSAPNDDPKLDVMLPLSRNFADYDEAILDSIKKISQFENRDTIEIINDLIVPPSDIVRFKIQSESTSLGIIPLDQGFELLESAKKAILSSASDLIAPSLFHKRMAYKSALQFINSCYLGQTERGSFVASIICPFIDYSNFDDPIQLSLFSSQDMLQNCLTRNVTKKLMSSLNKVKSSIDGNSTIEIVHPSNLDLISCNFLESIVEINEVTPNSRVVITMDWSTSTRIPENIPNNVEFTYDYVEPLRSIIDQLRPSIMDVTGVYVGKISKIQANPDALIRDFGEITFVFIGDDEKAISARVILNDSDLHQAIIAFDRGNNVKIKGKLKVLGRQKIIEDPEFQLID